MIVDFTYKSYSMVALIIGETARVAHLYIHRKQSKLFI